MKKKSRIIIFIVLFAVILGMGIHIYTRIEEANVDFSGTATVSELPGNVNIRDKSELSFTGVVRWTDTYDVRSLVKGRVQEIYVKDGQKVSKGDKLFLINNRDEIKASKQAWDTAIASVSELKALSDTAVENLKADTSRFENKDIDAKTYKQSIDAVNMANAELDKKLEESEHNGIKYDVAIKNSLVTSPLDGTVGSLRISQRQAAEAGTGLCEIRDTRLFYVEIAVDESVAGLLYITEPMSVMIGETSLSGSIMDIITPSDNKDGYVVKVMIDAQVGIEEGAAAVVRFADAAYTR